MDSQMQNIVFLQFLNSWDAYDKVVKSACYRNFVLIAF